MNNYFQEKHVMICERVLENGIDVYYCPACGRKMLVQWAPIIRQVVIDPGDETAIHNATPYELSHYEIKPVPIEETEIAADPADAGRLAQWEQWLEQVGFESWWARGTG